MTTRLPFIDRIKVLTRGFIRGKSVALNRPPSYEVEILPSSTQKGKQKSPSSSVHPIKPGVKVAAPRVFASAMRICLVNQRSGWDVEHPRSNLG